MRLLLTVMVIAVLTIAVGCEKKMDKVPAKPPVAPASDTPASSDTD